ncbi:MAG: flagellar hook capping FlgD N-terminal domain-containing protein [Agathobacter sp.]|nr:flagellar hook capping FlgD N-terminal domain-containing protein [Lachnobacterium sp.]MDY2912122.1 flagellar hook capping FlgD N-terminal domain-containing protein [Agathobacter sp.]
MAIIAKVENGKIDSSVSSDKVAAKNTNTNIGKSTLGYDEFLKLLTAEMQYQDPLEPTSNTDYVAQMATFSQLEATLSMKESLTASSDNTIKSMANQLVGQEVVVEDDESKTGYADGIVDYVMYEDGEIYISVNDKLYSIDKLDTISTKDYYEAVVSANTLHSMITALPSISDITYSYKKAVEQIRELYDGFTDYQKKYVKDDDLDTLKQYESKMEELAKLEKKDDTDESGSTEGTGSEGTTDSTEGTAETK